VQESCTSGEKFLGPNVLGAKSLGEMSCGLKAVGQMPWYHDYRFFWVKMVEFPLLKL
jgi:hypothetical protein